MARGMRTRVGSVRGGLIGRGAAALGALAALAGAASAQTTYVIDFGDIAPRQNDFNRPYQFIESAIWQSTGQPSVRAWTGTYYSDRLEAGRNVRIFAGGGDVVIRPTPSNSTTFDVMSYNTHLFGDALVGAETWLDEARAVFIQQYFRSIDEPDVVGLQEVWDGSFPPTLAVGFNSGFYGSRFTPHILNSGLMLLSDLPLQNAAQVDLRDGANEDFFANKGYVRATVFKNGFGIGIFNTHLQAGNNGAALSARADQLAELRTAVQAYRATFPSHVVILMGDLNVDEGGTEFFNALRPALNPTPSPELRNPAFDTPFTTDADACTSCGDNPLKQYFGGSGDTTLDYVFYADSLDNTVEIIPRVYDVLRPEIPPPFPAISDDGLTTRVLSDHDAVYVSFDIIRR